MELSALIDNIVTNQPHTKKEKLQQDCLKLLSPERFGEEEMLDLEGEQVGEMLEGLVEELIPFLNIEGLKYLKETLNIYLVDKRD
ncbi:hypothetical protein [Bacillus pumilus]|uniref:hypothetical protein n=1 Tax=Bacillus pumilus TaxID=1408 RepID=UPI00119F8A59|nr:hypothetical protein [Bacillus pumilus]